MSNPVDSAWVRSELSAIQSERNASKKGRRLEYLVCRVFCQVPGLSIENQDIMNAFKTQEMDLYFFNARDRTGLHFLDCPLIIECKGWSEAVDGREIQSFAALLRHKGRRDGIFVALNGITGRAEVPSAGFYHVTASLIEGQLVLVITGDDLINACDPDALVALLQRRMLDQVKGQILSAQISPTLRKKSTSKRKRPKT